MKKNYLVIVGARPNFIKAAPLFKRVTDFPNLEFTLVHTGQHFDHNMSKIFFEQMGIPKPDIQLEIKDGNFSDQIGNQMSQLKEIISDGNYAGVIVFGDINSTLSGAIAAKTQGKKLIHIEAGLRSHDKRMPEELNRIIADHSADLLFVTEPSGVDNLLSEGVDEVKINLVGNIMIESIELFKSNFSESDVLPRFNINPKEYVIATIHRIENTSDVNILRKILETMVEVSKVHKVILPLHPGTKKYIEAEKMTSLLESVQVVEPVGYLDFMKLIIESKGVITDSGGIQEETSHLGIPCCTIRDNTERPITVELGTNKLFPIKDLNHSGILEHIDRAGTKSGLIPLWDGRVSERILNLL